MTDTEATAADDLIDKLLDGRRLLLVSNREPYVRKNDGDDGSFRRTAGGLVTALDPVMRRCGGVWIAWEPGGDRRREIRHEVPDRKPTFTLRQVPLSTGEVRRYYYGFANRALWPMFHYFVDRCHFDEEDWFGYERVNQRFAEVVAEESRPGDVIWIHDYHFCLLPKMIRERVGDDRTIAFFLHIPFPAEEVFRILPWREEVLSGLLGADLVGLHVPPYAEHFLDACHRLLGAEIDLDRCTVEHRGREVSVGAFPIGIDTGEFRRLAGDPEIQSRAAEIRGNLGAERIVLGVDRMDYSKGIPERLAAIDRLYENHPEHLRATSFVQIAVPSRTKVREYRNLKREIDELVGRINGRHGDADWQPISYLFRGLPRPELVAHYLAADVALITPLRDGMNLVAKEFCACHGAGDAVLVLSEFTGAAADLGDDALLVNPFDINRSAETIHQALTMDPVESGERMRRLLKRVDETEIHRWVVGILGHIGADAEETSRA